MLWSHAVKSCKIAFLIVNENHILIDMNDQGKRWFETNLNIGDYITDDHFQDQLNNKVNILIGNGYFKIGTYIYKYVNNNFIYDNITYQCICITDETISVRNLENAEKVVNALSTAAILTTDKERDSSNSNEGRYSLKSNHSSSNSSNSSFDKDTEKDNDKIKIKNANENAGDVSCYTEKEKVEKVKEELEEQEQEGDETTSKLQQTEYEKCRQSSGFGLGSDPNGTMITYNMQGIIVDCSNDFRGYTREELIGSSSYECIHPDDIPKVSDKHVDSMQDNRNVVPVLQWMRKKHKSERYVHTEFSGSMQYDEDGNCWIGGCERVLSTDRMEKVVLSVLNQVPCGVIMVDTKSGYIEMCNHHAVNWLNLNKNHNLLNRINKLNGITFTEKETKKLYHAIQQCHKQIIKDKTTGLIQDTEITVQTKQGRVLTFLGRSQKNPQLTPTTDNSSPTDDDKDDNKNNKENEEDEDKGEGEKKGEEEENETDNADITHSVLWIVTDVTGLSKAMDQKNEAIVQFMRCTSHDMRTPMQAITLAAYSIKEDYNDVNSQSLNNSQQNIESESERESHLDSLHSDVDTIIASSAVLETIVSNILEFKTINSMKIIKDCSLVNIKEKVDRIVGILNHSTLISNRVKLTSNYLNWDHTQPQFYSVDDKLLDRIILNIVSNSLKFTDSGSVTVTCSVKKRERSSLMQPTQTASSLSSPLLLPSSSASSSASTALSLSPLSLQETNKNENNIQNDNNNNNDVNTSGGHEEKAEDTTCGLDEEDPLLLCIEISDTGRGMDEKARKHLGEFGFFAGDEGGFGLGTYIVMTYVKILNGTFEVESEVGVGTKITITIPTNTILLNKNDQQKNKKNKQTTYVSDHENVNDNVLNNASWPQKEQKKDDNQLSENENEKKRTIIQTKEALRPSFDQTEKINTLSMTQRNENENENENNNNNNNNKHNNKQVMKNEQQQVVVASEEDIKSGFILVVEDVPINRKLLVKSLKRGGFEGVEEAENGAIALKMMFSKEYRTVFMDINMPIMNGDIAIEEYWKQCQKEEDDDEDEGDEVIDDEDGLSTVTTNLKQSLKIKDSKTNKVSKSESNKNVDTKKRRTTTRRRERQHPKFCVLTGNITDADREKALACGAHEFLTKPIRPKDVLNVASWTV